MHGHSLGAFMVSGVGGEVSTYAPELSVRGVIMNAGGLTGPNSPAFGDPGRARLIDTLGNVESAQAKALALALAAQYEQAYAPDFRAADYLTPMGLDYLRQITDLCTQAAESVVSNVPFEQLFHKQLPLIDIGSESRLSSVPTWLIAATSDERIEPLVSYHAYQTLCAAGQPTYLSLMQTNHGGALRALAPNDATGLKDWVTSLVTGRQPSGSCAAVMQPKMTAWSSYSATQIAKAFAMVVTPSDVVTVAASGSCQVDGRGVVTLTAGGDCTLALEVRRGVLLLSSRIVSAQSRA